MKRVKGVSEVSRGQALFLQKKPKAALVSNILNPGVREGSVSVCKHAVPDTTGQGPLASPGVRGRPGAFGKSLTEGLTCMRPEGECGAGRRVTGRPSHASRRLQALMLPPWSPALGRFLLARPFVFQQLGCAGPRVPVREPSILRGQRTSRQHGQEGTPCTGPRCYSNPLLSIQ